MRKRTIVLAACVLLVAAAFAQDKSIGNAVGTWKMNVQKSTAPVKPKSLVVKVTEDSPTALKFSVTGVDANGKPIHETYNGAPDGQPHPISGSPTASAIAYTRTGNTGHATWTLKNGGSNTQDITLSDDGKTMTVETKSGDKSWTEVYDRVGAGHKKAAAK